MVCLAERQVRSTSALTLGAAFALTLVASLRTGTAPAALPPVPVVEPVPALVEARPLFGMPCPDTVSESLHLDSSAVVRCIPGNYGQHGLFVHATYATTEMWERYGVVADDGTVLVAMVDRPMLHPYIFEAVDVDGDGVDEVVGMDVQCADLEVSLLKINGHDLVIWSEHQRLPRAECTPLVMGFHGGAFHVYDAQRDLYRIDFANKLTR